MPSKIKFVFAYNYIASSIPIKYKQFANRLIWLRDRNLTGITTPGESGSGSIGNESSSELQNAVLGDVLCMTLRQNRKYPVFKRTWLYNKFFHWKVLNLTKMGITNRKRISFLPFEKILWIKKKRKTKNGHVRALVERLFDFSGGRFIFGIGCWQGRSRLAS